MPNVGVKASIVHCIEMQQLSQGSTTSKLAHAFAT